MGVPVVYVKTMFDDSSRPVWQRWRAWLRQVVHHRIVDCVVVSSGVMKDALPVAGASTKVEVVPHGVDLRRFKPAPLSADVARAKEEIGLSRDDEVVLCVAPIIKRKGLDYLASAWGRVAEHRPHARLLLVGSERPVASGRTSFGDELRRTLSRGHGDERVTFVGSVRRVERYLSAADVFVFPSLKEGMPNVVCEAMSAGVACVLTPFMGLPREFGRPGEQYLLVDHDPDEIASGITSLLTDPRERERLGNGARSWVEEHLALDVTVDLLTRIIRDLGNPRAS